MTDAASIRGSVAAPSGRVLARVTSDRLIVVAAYVLSWGLLLVNRGLYWDDWTLVGVSPQSLVSAYSELGMPWFGYFFTPLVSLPLPGLVGHVLVFVTYLLSALILHAVLLRVPGLGWLDALVVALVFAVLPVNYARIALIDLPYGLCLLAFLAGTWFLIRHVEEGGPARRVAALALFLFSFFTASLLVLYVVPVGLAAYVGHRSGRVPLRSFVVRYLDFFALPVAYWLVKSVFFKPSGVYEGYNAITLHDLLEVPRAMLAIPGQVLFEPLYRAIAVGGIVGIAIGVLVAAWLVRRSRVDEAGDLVAAPVLAIVGVVLVALGVFAYLAVDRIPTIWDWSSRHQLLVPLGIGFLAAACLRGVAAAGRAGPVFAVAIGLLLGISIVADARTLVAYQDDWYKQVALMDAARTIPAVQSARHIVVTDAAKELDALRRAYRFYEYNALFSTAIGGTDRLISDGVTEPAPADLEQYISRPAYHMGDYVPSPVDLDLHVALGTEHTGTLETLRLVVLEALGSPSFETEASHLIDVTASPAAGSGAAP